MGKTPSRFLAFTSYPLSNAELQDPVPPSLPLIVSPINCLFDHISSWPRSIQVVSMILSCRYLSNRIASPRSYLRHMTELAVCFYIQRSSFSSQLLKLRVGTPLNLSWAELSPFLDSQGIIIASSESGFLGFWLLPFYSIFYIPSQGPQTQFIESSTGNFPFT